MANSIVDQISSKLAPVIRQLKDINISILGTQTQLLRLTTSTPDLFGDSTETFEMQIVDNAIIKHPWGSNIQMFGSMATDGSYITSAIDLWEVLPIEIRFKFNSDRSSKITELKNGDLLVEVLRDENGNKIPLIMQTTKGFGAFMDKYIVSRYAEATLYRGTLNDTVKAAIDTYVAGLK